MNMICNTSCHHKNQKLNLKKKGIETRKKFILFFFPTWMLLLLDVVVIITLRQKIHKKRDMKKENQIKKLDGKLADGVGLIFWTLVLDGVDDDDDERR